MAVAQQLQRGEDSISSTAQGAVRGFFSIRGRKKNCLGPSPFGAAHSVGSGPTWEGKAELVGSERTNPTLCHGLTPTHPGTGLDPCSRDWQVWKHAGNCPGAAEGLGQGQEWLWLLERHRGGNGTAQPQPGLLHGQSSLGMTKPQRCPAVDLPISLY